MSRNLMLATLVLLPLTGACDLPMAPEAAADGALEPSHAVLTRPRDIVVYDGRGTGLINGDIWLADEDQANPPVNLTQTPVGEISPDLSPDGTTIAYAREGKIWLMGVDGRNQRPFTTGPGFDPAWSEDGSQIAFVRRVTDIHGMHDDLYVINADGTGEGPLVQAPGNQMDVTAYPGGGWTYVSDGWIVGDGLPAGISIEGFAPDWAADGTKFAYHRTMGTVHVQNQIYVYDPNGAPKGSPPFWRVTNSRDEDLHDMYPSWAPDGEGIAFVRGPEPNLGHGVEVGDVMWVDQFYFPHPFPLVDGKARRVSWGPCGALRRTIC